MRQGDSPRHLIDVSFYPLRDHGK